MSNYQVGVPLVGTRITTGDSRKQVDTRPAPTWHKAGCFVAQGFIPANLYTEFRMLNAVCFNLVIDHSLLDIGYLSFLFHFNIHNFRRSGISGVEKRTYQKEEPCQKGEDRQNA